MEHAVNIFNRLGGQTGFFTGSRSKRVVEALNGVGIQGFQFDCTQCRLDMISDLAGVGCHGKGFDTAQIVGGPEVQPFSQRDFTGLRIGTRIDLDCGSLEPFPHLLLCFSGEGSLDLLAGARIKANGEPGLPVDVFLTIFMYNLLADVAGAGSIAGQYAIHGRSEWLEVLRFESFCRPAVGWFSADLLPLVRSKVLQAPHQSHTLPQCGKEKRSMPSCVDTLGVRSGIRFCQIRCPQAA